VAWLVVVIVVLWAVVPGMFTTSSPVVGNVASALQPPSIHHIFGTDDLGRDMYTRMVYGASHTLSATLYAVAVGFLAGGTIGLIGGTRAVPSTRWSCGSSTCCFRSRPSCCAW